MPTAETISQVQFPKVFICGPSGYVADVDSGGHLLTTGSGNATSIDGVTVTGTPNPGQVLTATGAAAANWQTPAGASGWQFKRSAATAFTQGGITGPIAMDFPVPFADGDYTVVVTARGNEAAPGTPTVTQFPSVGVSYYTQQSTPGHGINVWVANNDSIAHTGIVDVMAYHA
jgi:hypothetical protein